MVGRFHLRLVGVLALLLLAAAPAGARAPSSFSSLTIGPIRAENHYSLRVEALACNAKHPSVEVIFMKTFRGGSEAHSYAANTTQHCHVAADVSTASLSLRLGGGMANIDLTFRKKGPARHGRLGPGCTGTRPLMQTGVVTGTLQVAIDSTFFGRIRVHRVRASITRFSTNIKCKPQPPSRGPLALFAQFGRLRSGSFLGAFRAPGIGRGLSVTTTTTQRSHGVTASHSIALSGKGLVFAASGNLDSAHIDAPGGLIQGDLRFTAKPGSKGANRMGTLSGTLRLHFDLIGTQTLKGSSATHVFLARGSGVSVFGGSGAFSGSFFG